MPMPQRLAAVFLPPFLDTGNKILFLLNDASYGPLASLTRITQSSVE